MLLSHANATTATRELSEAELAQVSGGMKVDPNYTSANVIDARGGYTSVYGVVTTYDVNGQVSSLGGVQIPHH